MEKYAVLFEHVKKEDGATLCGAPVVTEDMRKHAGLDEDIHLDECPECRRIKSEVD